MEQFSVSEAMWRRMAACQMANEFIGDFCFRSILSLMSPEQAADICAELRKAAEKNDQFEGLTRGDDYRAEQVADLVVRARQIVFEVLDKAEKNIREASGGNHVRH